MEKLSTFYSFGNYFCLLLIFLCITACDIFEYSPNQIILDEEEQDINAKNIARLSSAVDKDTIRLILMGDTQRFYEEAEAFVESANAMEGIDFVIHAGDISDFGLAKEFIWVNEIMADLKVPYITVIGNHDLVANGAKVYQKMFGPMNFSFFYAGVKFVFFDSNSREYKFNGNVPDLDWLSQEIADTSAFDQAIMVSHIPPFDADTDPDMEEDYAAMIAKNGKVNLSLHGHQHSFTIGDYYSDGVTYVVSTTVDKNGYALITLYGNDFEVEKIYF